MGILTIRDMTIRDWTIRDGLFVTETIRDMYYLKYNYRNTTK